jgi:acetyl esterase/lipase
MEVTRVVSRRAFIQTGVFATLPPALSACVTAGEGNSGGAPRTAEPLGTVVDLWPSSPPGGENVTVTQSEIERSKDPTFRDVAVVNTTTPTLTLFRPNKPNGASMLIIPGGGYQRVVVGKEGYQIAKWLTNEGVAAFVLLYRLPADGWAAGPNAPLQDAQRAVRLIRANATQFGLDPARVGVMGFSAGGHLAARLATRFDLKTYTPLDDADNTSPRPDIAALGYPVISFRDGVGHMGSRTKMLGANPDAATIKEYSAEIDVPQTTPPCFLMCAADDPAVPVDNSLLMFQALRRAKIPAALHIFEGGGHGFGLQSNSDPSVAAWPSLFLEWSRQHRFIAASQSQRSLSL